MGIDNDLEGFDFSDWNINEDLFDSDIADSYNIPDYELIYDTIAGYPNYKIYRDGSVWNIKRNTGECLKHTRHKNGGGPRVMLSNGKSKSFLVAKILIATFKSKSYDFAKDLSVVHYRDHNSCNISLENIFIEIL